MTQTPLEGPASSQPLPGASDTNVSCDGDRLYSNYSRNSRFGLHILLTFSSISSFLSASFSSSPPYPSLLFYISYDFNCQDGQSGWYSVLGLLCILTLWFES